MNHNPLIRSELRDTALTVSALSAGFSPEHASTWYEYCKTLVENLRKNLASSGRSAEEIEEISYAQCALLDEVALQNLQGSDREVWEMNPMQVHFFQSYNAGDVLCDKIEKLCKTGSANSLIAEAYLSVINLGFKGRYILDEMALQNSQNSLKKMVSGLSSNAVTQDGQIFYVDRKSMPLKSLFTISPIWVFICCSVIAVVAYFAFGYYLDTLAEQTQAL